MSEQPKAHHVILLHSVLVPMCRLIPIPFLDDIVQEQLERRHVTGICKAHGRQLSGHEVKSLCGHDGGGGCSCLGCLLYVPLLPFKKILRKILYFLEWKATIDLAARTYIEGYAFDYILGEGLWPSEDPEAAKRVHDALDRIVEKAGTSPIEAAFKQVWSSARLAIISTAQLLAQRLKKLVGLEKEAQRSAVTRVLDEIEQDQKLEATLVKLTQALSQVHGEYFDRLRQLTRDEFKVTGTEPDEAESSPTADSPP